MPKTCSLETAVRLALIGDNAVTQVMPLYKDKDISLEICDKEDADYWLISDISSIKNAVKANKTVIFLSTAQVFIPSNEKAWSETDNEYCDSAIALDYLKQEDWIKKNFEHHVILRTTRIISPQSSIWHGAEQQDFSPLDDTLLIAPVFAEETARIIIAILKQIDCHTEADLYGTFHYGGAELYTEFTLAQKLAKIMHDGEPPIMTIQSAHQLTALSTLRLNCKKILSCYGIRQQPARRLLQRMITQL